MTREEIIHKIITYIDLQLEGRMGEIYQDPYRGAFFDLFVEAYNQGLIADKSLTVGALLGTLQDQWYSDADGRNMERSDFVEDFLLYWHAWEYAWNHSGKKVESVSI